MIHNVKGFGIVNKAEVAVFLKLCCFFDDPADVGHLISGCSAFSTSSLNIWKFMVHVLLKPGLENFEHYFASPWDYIFSLSTRWHSYTLGESESRWVVYSSVWPPWTIPWNSPGQNTGVGSFSLLQEIFLTQKSKRSFLHCRWILYQLSYQGSLSQSGKGLEKILEFSVVWNNLTTPSTFNQNLDM